VAFPFVFGHEGPDTAVDIEFMLARNRETWTWLHSSRSHPARLAADEWPTGLARSVDIRNAARKGSKKGAFWWFAMGPPAVATC
jgi:hypothetical protein